MINAKEKKLSISQQCSLIGLHRSAYYFKAKDLTLEDLRIMRQIDEIFTEQPCYGTRRMVCLLKEAGYNLGRKKVRRYYQILGIEAIYPKMNLSRRNFERLCSEGS